LVWDTANVTAALLEIDDSFGNTAQCGIDANYDEISVAQSQDGTTLVYLTRVTMDTYPAATVYAINLDQQ